MIYAIEPNGLVYMKITTIIHIQFSYFKYLYNINFQPPSKKKGFRIVAVSCRFNFMW